MNNFGRIYKLSIFGESHEDCIGIGIDGCPPGIPIKKSDFEFDLKRRMPGKYGTTERIESDIPQILSGVFNGKTTGTPILILFKNKQQNGKDYEINKFKPRPGHADFVAYKKYKGYNDYRGGGHFSGRITASLVAAGVIAKKVITPMKVNAKIKTIGEGKNREPLKKAVEEGDSIGGIIECIGKNIPVGLGEPFFDSIESKISHAIFSIPGIKGIEFGSGFKSASMKGSEFNDEIIDESGRTNSNHSGGINGGITNGNNIIFRVCVRPTASIKKKQFTINLRTHKKTEIKVSGRHDVCIALRIPVIVEAITAIVLADFLLTSKGLEVKSIKPKEI